MVNHSFNCQPCTYMHLQEKQLFSSTVQTIFDPSCLEQNDIKACHMLSLRCSLIHVQVNLHVCTDLGHVRLPSPAVIYCVPIILWGTAKCPQHLLVSKRGEQMALINSIFALNLQREYLQVDLLTSMRERERERERAQYMLSILYFCVSLTFLYLN